jgi:hypothetical protein
MVIALLLLSCLGYGADKASRFEFSKAGKYVPQAVMYGFAKHWNEGFDFTVWLSSQLAMGQQAWDGTTPPTPNCLVGISAQYPSGACIEHLYGAAPWVAGIINGRHWVSEGYNGDDASKEFVGELQDTLRDSIWVTAASDTVYNPSAPGYYKTPMNRRGFDDDGDGKIDEDELDGLDNDGDWIQATDDVGADGIPDSLEVGCKGGYDPVTNPDPAYDDYCPKCSDECHPLPDGSFMKMSDPNRYTEKNGIPDHGEPHVDEDYAAVSDMDAYLSATDTSTAVLADVPSHFPMYVKLEQKTYAWANTEWQAIMPMTYELVNVGHYDIKNVYFGFFADEDVGPVNISGYYAHNYAAYLDTLRTAYINNPVDRGSTPMGLTVLQTPRPLDSLRYIFQWWDFTTRTGPGGSANDSLTYEWMSGDEWGPSGYIWPNQSPNALSDSRFMFSFGPFADFPPHDTLRIVVAWVAGYCVDQCAGSLVDNAEAAIKGFNSNWYQSVEPPSPNLKVTQGFKAVTLEWGSHLGKNPLTTWDDSNHIAAVDSTTQLAPGVYRNHPKPPGHVTGGRVFEGYRLYRSEDPNGTLSSFTLLRQFDVIDQFPYNTPNDRTQHGLTEPIRLYSGTALETTFVDTDLVRGKTYWYAVTSYGIPSATVLQIPDTLVPGGIAYDTLLSANTESSIQNNYKQVILAFSPSYSLGQVLAVPNPYRTDANYTYENGGWEGRASQWNENDRLIKFIHLPLNCTIRVFTLAGDLVTELNNYGSQTPGEISWNILSASGRALASGLYIFTVESQYGRQVGKFVLIR